jgi:excisionase family DNA binding protein
MPLERKGMNPRGKRQPIRKLSHMRMFTVQEVAAALHVHPNTVRHWSDEGLLKSSRIGPRGDRRFSWEDVNSFLNHWDRGAQSGNSYQAKVLIVDDERRIRGLLRDIVEEQGYEAVSVESGERALQELERRDFDLIFLDLVLPGLDGVEVLRAIKAKGNNAVVAVVTGYGDEPIALEAMSLGPLILIRKPFDAADIIKVLSLTTGAKIESVSSA